MDVELKVCSKTLVTFALKSTVKDTVKDTVNESMLQNKTNNIERLKKTNKQTNNDKKQTKTQKQDYLSLCGPNFLLTYSLPRLEQLSSKKRLLNKPA